MAPNSSITVEQTHLPILEYDLCQRVELFLRGRNRDFANIAVHDEEGVLHLTGQVPTYYLRQIALECAKRVAGARNVIDELRVPNRQAVKSCRRMEVAN